MDTGYVDSIIEGAGGLLSDLLVLLISLAVVWLIWNVIKYTMSSEDDDKSKAKSQMIWGIVALAVIVSIWGLVAILTNMFGSGGYSADSFGTEINGMIPTVK